MKLSDVQLTEGLKDLPGWSRKAGSIEKQFVFNDFKEAMSFVNSVAELAEKADHHPDIIINYRKVTLTLSTHSEGGVTEKDIDLAGKIEELA